MTDKQINSWLRKRFSPLGWVLIGYYFLINGMSLLTMLWEALDQLHGNIARGGNWFAPMDTEAMTSNAWGYILAVAVLFVILHAWKGPGYWREEVFVRQKPIRPGVLLGVMCMCMGSQMVNSFWVGGLEVLFNLSGKSLLPLLESVSGDASTFSMFLYASILAPVAEELLFRGYILRTMQPFGRKFAVFASAFLFGLFHGNLLQTPYAFLMGLLLGWLTVEYSVVWAIAVHMFNNLVLADILTRVTNLMPSVAGDLVQLSILGSALAASSVILFVKREEIAEYLCREWMDRRVLKCFFTSGGILVLLVLMAGNIVLMLP